MSASVVVPVKDEAGLLPRLLAALAAQRPAVEVVVAIAPDTTDRSRELVAAGGVRWVEGGTPAVGRNAGARVASGATLVFLDADVLPPDDGFVARACAGLARQGLDIGAARYRSLGTGLGERFFYALYNALQATATAVGQPYYMGACLFVRRPVHEALGGFDAAIAFAEDYEYVARAVGRGHRAGLLRGVHIVADGRRIREYGLGRTLWAGLRAELHRRRHGEIHDLGVVDPHYFERRSPPASPGGA
ncbi:MAG: glycosyltransferase [Myxococcales bacterium]|nr:glycosyltransferase [Myxococcales bacterium]